MRTKVAKLTGTIESEEALDRMVRAVNEGFSNGKVSKHNLVSWALIYFENHCFQNCLEKLRQDHFDQVAYIESLLKEAKLARRTGASAEQIAAILPPLTGGAPRGFSTRRKKTATEPTSQQLDTSIT